MKNDNLASFLSKNNFWKSNSNKIWLASSISLFRNLNKFNFPGKLSTERQKSISTLVGQSILKNNLLQNPQIFTAEELNASHKELIAERFLGTESIHQAHSGEGFIINESGNFFVTTNLQDHIHIQIMNTDGELVKCLNQLVKLESTLGKSMTYAFSKRFGFLTSDPSYCGTGLILRIFLQLPALIHTEAIENIFDDLIDESISISGLYGNPTEMVGDVICFKNNYTLGVTEENILSNLETLTMKLIAKETTARKEILEKGNSQIKDLVSRAYAILMHSYQIEAVESLNALSLLKLGIDLNWVTGITISELNELFFNSRRVHLICHYNQELSQEELPHKRAEFNHKALGNVKLTI